MDGSSWMDGWMDEWMNGYGVPADSGTDLRMDG